MQSPFFAILDTWMSHNVVPLEAPTQSQATAIAFQKAKEIGGAGVLGVYSSDDMEELINELSYMTRLHKHTMIYGLAPRGSRFEDGNFWAEWKQEENIFLYEEALALLESAKNAGVGSSILLAA